MLKKRAHRCTAAVLAVSACALALPAGASAINISLPTLTLPTPSPGHASIEVLSLKITGRDALKNGNTFEATTPDRTGLPSSVRVFSAARAIRKSSSLTYAFYILAVNKGSGTGAGASVAAPAAFSILKFASYPLTGNVHALVVRFTPPSKGNGTAALHGHKTARRIYCDTCKANAVADAVINVDVATPPFIAPITGDLKTLFGSGSVFKRAKVALYDNGHAFNLKEKGARAALKGVAADVIAQKTTDVLATIKRTLGASL